MDGGRGAKFSRTYLKYVTHTNEYNAKSIVKENTCFKNTLNPGCIDIFITNSEFSKYNSNFE